jgi:hypothetical protein
MPIIRKDDVAPERPVIIVLYGQPGSGKTSVATTASNPLLIDTDRGYDRAVQRIDTLSINSWDEVIASKNDFKEYSTIIVDTAKAALDDFLSAYVCQQNYKLRSNTLKRFGQMGDEFKNFVSELRLNGSDIIFVCHDKEVQNGDNVNHSPDCTGQSKDLLLRIADQVGYISIINGKRHICFDALDNYVGKNVAQIPLTEIPDANTSDFEGFMGNIIKQVKTSIQSKSEAQQKANALRAKLREDLLKVEDNEGAAALIKECAELPNIMKAPFFNEIMKTLASKGFTYNKEKGAFLKEEAKPKTKKDAPTDK